MLTRLGKSENDSDFDSDSLMDLEENNDFEPPKKKMKEIGRPPKPTKKLGDCSPKQMKRRTKPFFDAMVEECEKNEMNFDQFLGLGQINAFGFLGNS